MKIYLILITILLLTLETYSQKTIIDCSNTKGGIYAENDLKKNKLGYYIWGSNRNYTNSWSRIFEKEYNIKIKRGGCLKSSFGMCYNEIMIKHIKAKYGDRFIQKVDEKFDNLRKKDLIDRDPIYIGNDDIKKEIISNLNQEKLNDAIVTIQFIVKENGLLKEISLHGNESFKNNIRYEIAILKVFNKMKETRLWRPAIFNQKEVESYYQNLTIELYKK